MRADRLTRMALLVCAALVLSVVEAQIPNPVPIPGVKLGLANIVTVYAVYHYNAREVCGIVFCRVVLAAMFSANAFALLYSLAGSALCLCGMLPLRRVIDEKHLPLASVCGAVLHNIGQLAAAALIMKTAEVFMYLPFLLVSGCAAGLATGALARIVSERLKSGG